MFQGVYPSEPNQDSAMKLAVLAAPADLHRHFTTFENSKFVQKLTLVKLLG